jgi:hypothetical protein
MIPLPPPLIPLLKLHREVQEAERATAGEEWQDWDLVWCRPGGGPIEARDDWEDWKELLHLAEVEKDARVHDAWHTAAVAGSGESRPVWLGLGTLPSTVAVNGADNRRCRGPGRN